MHANQTTQEWLTRADYQQRKNQKQIFNHVKQKLNISENVLQQSQPIASKNTDENYRNNLLAKIPINSTIIGSSNLLTSPINTPMNRSFTDDFKLSQNVVIGNDTSSIGSGTDCSGSIASIGMAIMTKAPKTIYNSAIDAFTLFENRRGFLNTISVNLAISQATAIITQPIVGVYCVRWRRTGETNENETKLIVNCVGKCEKQKEISKLCSIVKLYKLFL